MAKIKLGAIVTDIRNKLGGHVFSKNRSGSYMRTLVTPVNPQTSFQSSVRSLFATISQGWGNLSDAQREAWRAAVGQYAKTDVFGDIKNLTGKALYQSINQNLNLIGVNSIDTPQNSQQPEFNATFTPTIGITATEIGWGVNDSNNVTKVMVFATENLTPGTKFVKNKLRLVGFDDGDSNMSTDIYAAYVSRFGAPSQDSNIYIGIKFVDTSSGVATPLQVGKATISA